MGLDRASVWAYRALQNDTARANNQAEGLSLSYRCAIVLTQMRVLAQGRVRVGAPSPCRFMRIYMVKQKGQAFGQFAWSGLARSVVAEPQASMNCEVANAHVFACARGPRALGSLGPVLRRGRPSLGPMRIFRLGAKRLCNFNPPFGNIGFFLKGPVKCFSHRPRPKQCCVAIIGRVIA